MPPSPLEREETYTFAELMAERDSVERNHATIIEYLLNKNSYPLSEWKYKSKTAKPLREGIDYAQFYEDMEDFIRQLHN